WSSDVCSSDLSSGVQRGAGERLEGVSADATCRDDPDHGTDGQSEKILGHHLSDGKVRKKGDWKMKKSYVEYIIEETQKILAIDSPYGYTQNVADYLMKEYRKLGYEPVQTVKGGVLVKLGGKEEDNAILLEAHGDTLGAMVCERKGNG